MYFYLKVVIAAAIVVLVDVGAAVFFCAPPILATACARDLAGATVAGGDEMQVNCFC
jgi:hypothetical protein